MQHVYAATFAGSVTLLIAVAILYFDYGLWHEKYRRTDDVVTTSKQEQVQDDSLITVQSPGEMIGTFIKEATVKIKAIDTSGANVLKGKDVYTKENSEE